MYNLVQSVCPRVLLRGNFLVVLPLLLVLGLFCFLSHTHTLTPSLSLLRNKDYTLIDHLAHFDRERIPERVVHAKGAGAFGYFEVGFGCFPVLVVDGGRWVVGGGYLFLFVDAVFGFCAGGACCKFRACWCWLLMVGGRWIFVSFFVGAVCGFRCGWCLLQVSCAVIHTALCCCCCCCLGDVVVVVVFLCFTSAVRLVFSCPVPSTYGAAPLDPCPQVTTPELKSLCKGKMFSHVGKRTPVAVRFSTVRSCPHVNTFHTYPAPHIPRRVRIHQRYRFAITYGSLFHYCCSLRSFPWLAETRAFMFVSTQRQSVYVRPNLGKCLFLGETTYCGNVLCVYLLPWFGPCRRHGSWISFVWIFLFFVVRAARQRQPPWRWHNEASVSFHAL